MKILSLFDGMACGYEALVRAGIKIDKYYASEIDKYAIQIATKNHPDIIEIGDVCEVKGEDYKDIDLLIGGSPCQGFSVAGKMLNFNDPRSKLFFEYVRILREVKPKYFLLENVKMKKEWIDIISNELYGIRPIEINSSLVSAQKRRRLYWIGILENDEYHQFKIDLPKDKKLRMRNIMQSFVDRSYYLSKEKIEKIKKRKSYQNPLKHILLSQDLSPTLTARGAGEYHSGMILIRDKGKIRTLTPLECERLQTLPDNYTAGVSDTQRYKMLGNGWTVDVIAHIFRFILSSDNKWKNQKKIN